MAIYLALFAVLNILDGLSTWTGLRLGLPEGNPIPAMLLARGGEGAMFGAKAVAVLWSIAVLARYQRRVRWARVANGVMALVVVGNLAQIGG